MNFWFTIREGFKGFSRARLSTVITISSIVFSHLLIAMFLLLSVNVDSWIGDLRSKLEIELFMERTLSNADAQKLFNSIKQVKGIENAQYISKEDAAKRFEREFGRSVFEVLQSNPLPASITIILEPKFRNAVGAEFITKELKKLNGVEDIVYQKEVITLVDKYMDIIYGAGIVTIVLLITITFILLYNTIRLTIFARRDIIEIMQLVGAKNSFIKRPFVIEGLLQGFIGSGLACVFTYIVINMITRTVYPYLIVKNEIYLIIILSGILIGLFSSRISVNKHLEINS